MKKIATIIVIVLFAAKVGAQVNLQTGSATFSIPMFNWQDDKSRLNSVVALSYNSGNGLKVNDVASSVGQGWNLIAGGVITRMQVGEPDDQKSYNDNSPIEDLTKYPPGYLYDTASASKGSPLALTRYPIFGDQNHLYKQHNRVSADREMDYFSFQFNGFGGLFVLDKNNPNQAISLSDNHMKIWFTKNEAMATNQVNSGIRTTINAFFIQDENGLIYKFTKFTTTKILTTAYCDENLTEALTAPHFKNGEIYFENSFDKGDLVNPYTINNWYLSEIEDALTHRKITFSYNLKNINADAGTSLATYSTGYSIISHHKSVTQLFAVSSISYPDGHSINFNYGNPRVDFNGDSCLSSIDIMYQNRYLSKYQLSQSYFIKNRYGNPISPFQKTVARLCLTSVKQVGVDLRVDNQPYIFDYYLGSDAPDDFVPPPFFHIKDIWGFYNGNNSVTRYNNTPIPLAKAIDSLNNNELSGLCFLNGSGTGVYLNPKSGYAKNGLLKQVIYPTGGTLSYEYEQNTSVVNGTSTTIGGVHVSKTKTTDGGYQNDCAHPLITQYNYVDSLGSSSLWGMEAPKNSMTTYNHYGPEYKYYHYKFPFGECKYHYVYPGIMSRGEQPDLSTLQNVLQSPIFNAVLSTASVVTSALDVISVLAGGPIGPLIMDIIGGLSDIVLTCFTNQIKDSGVDVYYNSDMNAANPLPLQFWRVEMVANSGGIGKTVQEFTRDVDYPIWELTDSAFSMKQRYAASAYGLPKKITVYDSLSHKVKETQNVYDFSAAKQTLCPYQKTIQSNCSFISAKALVLKSSSQRNSIWSDTSQYNAATSFETQNYTDANGTLLMRVELYSMYKSRVQLSDQYERVFKLSDQSQYLETHTHYGYNEYNFQISNVTTTQSNGDVNFKNITYNIDYNDGSVLANLYNNNILSVPVSTNFSVQKAGSFITQYLGETVTEYTTTSLGDIKPKRTMEQRFAQPVTSMSLYSPTNASNNSIYKQTQAFSYDGSGNLVGLTDEGNHTVTNIYDYNDKYIVASVINADATADKSAYTGFETQNYFGGWSVSGSVGSSNYINSSSATGASCFSTNTSISFSAPLNTAKAYIVSFWANNNSVSVSGGSLIKSAPTINGFTYYEYSINAGSTMVTVGSSGNVNIDELRVYPKTARMRTVSYDPLVGKTSECDENNRITYYEYDELGRLRFIKDENRNIVKMYEYNTVSNKQSGCPTTYYNHYTSETVTKNNCGTTFIGSDTVYIIPAGKYSSTISQLDVDKKVENEIITSGQAFANTNAGCRQLFYNAAQSRGYTTQTCAIGTAGTTVTYTVPANKYISQISQVDADSLAWKEIFANGQAYANLPAHAACAIDTAGNWEANDSTAQMACGTGDLAGHRIVYMMDINPNSPTYNTWQWKDAGLDTTMCPMPLIPVVGSSTIANSSFFISLTNTATGTTYSNPLYYSSPPTSTTLFSVPAGTYNVTVYPSSGYAGSYVFQIGTYLYTVSAGSGPLNISAVVINTNADATIYFN